MLFKALPSGAGVGRAVEAASRPAIVHVPRTTPHLPKRREQNIGIMRIEGDIDAASVLVSIEHLLPTFAAIGSTENSAFRVRPIGMAQCRYKNNVWIIGIDDDFADGAAIVQTNIFPGLACVQRFVDAVALGNIAAQTGLPGSNVNDVVIGIRDGKAAD